MLLQRAGNWLGRGWIAAVMLASTAARGEDRFPPPEFSQPYHAPQTAMPNPAALWHSYADSGILLLFLLIASYLSLVRRSRRGLFVLTVASVAYFGFYRRGCVCPIGSIQNVALSVGNADYRLPGSVAIFFLLPLAFALFTGRVFCSSVCPLGAIQDLVLIRPLKVPLWLAEPLQLIPYLYLGLAVLGSSLGSVFLICDYDPFVSFFRMSGSTMMLLIGAGLLLLGMFVGRPYCRFLCPYGGILRFLSGFSRWRVAVSPAECVQCRLCEDACPFGAIVKPTPEDRPRPRADGRLRLAVALAILPGLIAAGWWMGRADGALFSRMDPTVRLADRIWLEAHHKVKGTTLESDAFRKQARSAGELYWLASHLRQQWRVGTSMFGAWVGLIIGMKLVGLCIRRRRRDYDADPSGCLSCARCYLSCPVEHARREGRMLPAGEQGLLSVESLLASSPTLNNRGAANGIGRTVDAHVAKDRSPISAAGQWWETARKTAVVGVLLAVVVSCIIATNQIRLRPLQPLNSPPMTALRAQLIKDPANEGLKQHIRRLDLDIRRTYFWERELARKGAYLILAGLALALLAMEIGRQVRGNAPAAPESPPDTGDEEDRRVRRSVSVFGAAAAIVLLTFSLPPSRDPALAYVKLAVKPVPAPSTPPPGSTPAGSEPQASNPELAEANPGIPSPGVATGLPLPVPGGAGSLPPPLPLASGQVASPVRGTTSPGIVHPIPAVERVPAAVSQAKLPSTQVFAANWPQFRGPWGVGVVGSPAFPMTWDGSAGKGVLWKSPVPLPGMGSPIVWGNRVFLSGADAKHRAVFCYDAGTGRLIWTGQVAGLRGSPAGALEIQTDTGYAAPTVATDGVRVFAMFGNGDLAAFDFSGKMVWGFGLGKPDNTYGHAASLVVCGNRLIVPFDQGSSADDHKSFLYAFDSATGQLGWRTARPVPNSWSTPIVINVGGRGELVTAANPFVIAYDPGTGVELWRAECLGGDVAPSPVFGGGMVFAASSGSNLAAIRPAGKGDVTKTGIAWMAQDDLPDIVSPLTDGHLVFLVVSEGLVACVDAANGKLLWEHEYKGSSFRSSPTLVGNRVYLFDQKGVMHAFEPGRAFKDLGSSPLGEKVNSSPAFVNGQIFVRGAADLFCIGAHR